MAPLCNDHYNGNVRTHTLLDEKEHDPEHRRGVCCRGKRKRLRTQEGCLLSGNITDHGRYRREAIRRYAPGCGRSVIRAIRCTSYRASCSRSLSSYCTPPIRDAESYIWSRGSYCSIPSQRGYLLETVEARQSWKIPEYFPEGPSRIPSRQRSNSCPDTAPSYVVVVRLAWNFTAGSFRARKGIV